MKDKKGKAVTIILSGFHYSALHQFFLRFWSENKEIFSAEDYKEVLSPASVNCAHHQEKALVTVHFANNVLRMCTLTSFLFVLYFDCMNFLRNIEDFPILQDYQQLCTFSNGFHESAQCSRKCTTTGSHQAQFTLAGDNTRKA